MGVVMERLQRALRTVAAGGDPARMLEEALAGAVVACGAAGGVVVATVGGRPKMLAANGPYAGAGIAMETAEAALANGRLTRRRFRNHSLPAGGAVGGGPPAPRRRPSGAAAGGRRAQGGLPLPRPGAPDAGDVPGSLRSVP